MRDGIPKVRLRKLMSGTSGELGWTVDWEDGKTGEMTGDLGDRGDGEA